MEVEICQRLNRIALRVYEDPIVFSGRVIGDHQFASTRDSNRLKIVGYSVKPVTVDRPPTCTDRGIRKRPGISKIEFTDSVHSESKVYWTVHHGEFAGENLRRYTVDSHFDGMIV